MTAPETTASLRLFDRDVRSVHALGVGGMGLGPLAIYLAGCGLRVSGGDDGMSAPMRRQLVRAGVELTEPDVLPEGVDLVVISSAIHHGHPGLARAIACGLRTVRRGELLAEVAKGRKLVAVCGSHGKTTTSAMLVMALRAAGGVAGDDAGYVLGGLLADDTIPPARAGAGEWLVAEIDESDGTIKHFSPELTLVVNLDWDHPDHYRRPEDLEAAFAGLFQRTRGDVLVHAGCAWSARALAAAGREGVTFGVGGDYSLESITADNHGLSLRLGGRLAADAAKVRAWGEFNALNAIAAGAAASLMGVAWRQDLLASFSGVRRRQTVLSAEAGVTVIEDYAHHPAEIRALLAGLRDRQGGGALRVVFQPHRFTRTRQFKDEFARALTDGVAELTLLEVYGAGEVPIAGGSTADLATCVRTIAPALPLTVAAAGEEDAALGALGERVRDGDMVAFVGAGDIETFGRRWAAGRRWDALAATLSAAVSAETPVKREEPLGPKTTMRVGGAARLYAEPAGVADLQALLRAAKSAGVPVWLLGRGSNLIVADEGVDGLVVSLRRAAWETFEPLPDGCVRVGAGLRLKELCGKAIKAGLGGFEFLEGIPGNLGGALRMNAGAMGGWMFDVVVSVELMTLAGDVVTLRREDMHVGYRHCHELESAIAIGAVLRPSAEKHSEEVSRQVDVYRDKRKSSQPREPSAGCIFKNPEGDSAGRLIDTAGLKGTRVGDAEVSPVHANFIVNHGSASAGDIIALVRQVRARVKQAHGVLLEPEALLYGRDWPDVL